jgi:RNA polymerase sigma factor (sigma-70 family)
MNAMIKTDSRTDAQLMAAFLNYRDEEAFEFLVRRHESLVLSVCFRILRDEHGARDAAQAVFLVLARKGASIDLNRPLGPWLHHVAYGVAVSARREREARRARERIAMKDSREQFSGDGDRALRELLDGELDGLPEKYRRPLILFHLEGMSLEETAERLGSPAGTVGAWLSRGRELLRDRLVRRGAGALSGTLLAAFLAREASARSGGWGFARAAARAAAGGAVPSSVVLMTKGALTMILIAKFKTGAAAVAAAGAILAAHAILSPGAPAAAQSAVPHLAATAVDLPAIVETPLVFEPFEREESPFPMTSDLVGHWKLDEEKGATSAADSAGKADGKVVGSAAFAEGKIGGALKLDGKGGHVELPNTDVLDKLQEGSFSLAAWFKPENVPPGADSDNDASYAIVAKTGWHLGLYYTSEKKFTMAHWLAGEKPDEPVWTGIGAWDEDYEPGHWYHVVGTVDRAGGKVAFYLNGEPIKTLEFTPNAASKKYDKETWKVGIGRPGAQNWSWPAKGSIDDVRIYGRALTAADVKTLYEGK